jgi:hypothetical protein
MPSLFNQLMQYLYDADTFSKLENDVKSALVNFSEYPVYDISNIEPLFFDIDNSDISKKPPHKWCWVEWRQDEGPGRFTYLVLLVYVDINLKTLDEDFGDGMLERVKGYDELYTSVMFKRYDGGAPFVKINGAMGEFCPIGTITQEDHHSMYMLGDNGIKMDSVLLSKPDNEYIGNEHMNELSLYRLNWSRLVCASEDIHRKMIHLPFTAFSLLHCKNIKEVEILPDMALQKARQRRGKLPLYGYHVLKLNVSVEEEHRVYGVSDSNDKVHMRHHMVRGHFKNLQHNRFKNKGMYWWPAHWRGNPDLGIVEKDYKIETV